MNFSILPRLGRDAKATVVKRSLLSLSHTIEGVRAGGRVNFPARFVEFRPAVRLYGEGRATGPPKD